LKGRNSKMPKKANHGARPCSSVMRKMKKLGWYKKVRANWLTIVSYLTMFSYDINGIKICYIKVI